MSNDIKLRVGRGVPTPKPKKWFGIKPEWVIAAAVVISIGMMVTAVLVFEWLGQNRGKPQGTFLIAGEIRVSGSGLTFGTHAGECRGTGGYTDLQEGAVVVVSNAAGRTIALGRLGAGKATTNGTAPLRVVSCAFPIRVDEVPDGESYYGISVTHRGTQQYSREQLTRPIQLTVG